MASPHDVPGVEPIFRHLDDEDLKTQQVRTQMHPDGQKSVWEKWFTFGSPRQAVPVDVGPLGPGHDRAPPRPPLPPGDVRAERRSHVRRCPLPRRHPHRAPSRRGVGPPHRRPRRCRALRGDDGRCRLLGRRPPRASKPSWPAGTSPNSPTPPIDLPEDFEDRRHQ